MRPDPVQRIRLSTVEVTPRTQWTFVEVETTAGLCGTGEATLSGQADEVRQALAASAPDIFAKTDADPVRWAWRLPQSLPEAAVRSALDLALWDIAAQRAGRSLATSLGDPQRDRVPVYANINRAGGDRSPAAIAAVASAAIGSGHDAIKIAPWDEVTPALGVDDIQTALAAGLARLSAVRGVIGPHRRLLVDCHWRLNPATAAYMIDAVTEFSVDWIECPLAETPAHAPAIAQIRGHANRRDMVLAGLETGIGAAGFRPFINAGAYDVMMPDIKYVGGLTETLRLASDLRTAGIALSLHNPSGPICHAASLQFSAVADDLHSLEVQFGETPLFNTLVGRELQQTIDGCIRVPQDTGLGVSLCCDVVDRYATDRWSIDRGSMA